MPEKPWWRDWRGVPTWGAPSDKELSNARVWGMRLSYVVWIVVAVVASLVLDNPLVVIIAAIGIATQVILLPKALRRRLLLGDPSPR